MNTLSWFIYWADVFPSLSLGISWVSFIVFLFSLGINLFLIAELQNKKYLWVTFVAAFCILLASFFPSKNTLYAIAASEMGEEVYKSEQGQKIVKQLSDWVEAQLKVNK